MTAPDPVPTALTTPDRRRLDLYAAGPPDGDVLLFHIPTAIPRLFDEHGHLSLAVDSLGPILDELILSEP